MTTFTPTTESARRRCAGFTLTELVVASTLTVFVLAGILTAFLFIGRSGANIANYGEMESQARIALEKFGEDARMASAVTSSSTTSLTLTVPYSSGSQSITYSYGQDPADSTDECFLRTGYDPISGQTGTAVLIKGVTAFQFIYYQIGGGTTTQTGSIKQVQLSLTAARNSQTVATATNTVLSSRFVMRNVTVSQ